MHLFAQLNNSNLYHCLVGFKNLYLKTRMGLLLHLLFTCLEPVELPGIFTSIYIVAHNKIIRSVHTRAGVKLKS